MEKEINCVNSKIILDYVKKHNKSDYPGLLKDLDSEIDSLPNPEKFLRDPNNWVSCTVVSKLWERARLLFDDEMTAFKIARHTIENTTLGYAQRIIVKAFWSTEKALKHAQIINDKWNRSKKIELLKIEKNRAVVRLHWDPQMDVSKDMCLYNQGIYSFIPIIWGGKPATCIEECCFFEGAPYCEYRFGWPARNRFHEIFSRFYTSKSVLMETIEEMEKDKKIIKNKYEEVNRLNVELNKKIKQLMAIQETGKAIISILELEKLLTIIMNLLGNVCRINRALILLVNEDKKSLEYIHGTGMDGDVPDEVKDYNVPLDRVSNILVRVVSTGRPEYVPDVKSSTLRKENIMLTHVKPTSVYVVPLITRSKVIGVIATDAVDGKGVPKETREILEIFGPQIAIAIENARLYTTLQDQMEDLKRSHALLSRSEKFSFLGNLAARLAHEIKNPLTAIGTFIQLLPKKYDDEEFRNDFHEIAMEETNRVNSLISELLDLVKTKESRFEFNDLHGLIDKMILLISPQSNVRKIEVIREYDPDIAQIKMDTEKIKQVILNILSNAIEFTPQGGEIRVSTKNRIENENPKTVHIEIKDNGPGIPESMINKIFDPYFTTKHKNNMHSGTGLGLFIAHQHIQDHGGSIEVKSEVNEGTTFILTLPYEPPRELLSRVQGKNHANSRD